MSNVGAAVGGMLGGMLGAMDQMEQTQPMPQMQQPQQQGAYGDMNSTSNSMQMAQGAAVPNPYAQQQQHVQNNFQPQPQPQPVMRNMYEQPRQFCGSSAMFEQQRMGYSSHQPVSTSVAQVNVNEKCPKCRGKGFVHESSMTHKSGDMDIKCFFCEDCKGCSGKGFFKGTQHVVTATNVFGQTSVNTVCSTASTCPKCQGNGWVHASSMKHKGAVSSKCFFCQDCNSCDGNGRM